MWISPAKDQCAVLLTNKLDYTRRARQPLTDILNSFRELAFAQLPSGAGGWPARQREAPTPCGWFGSRCLMATDEPAGAGPTGQTRCWEIRSTLAVLDSSRRETMGMRL